MTQRVILFLILFPPISLFVNSYPGVLAIFAVFSFAIKTERESNLNLLCLECVCGVCVKRVPPTAINIDKCSQRIRNN